MVHESLDGPLVVRDAEEEAVGGQAQVGEGQRQEAEGN
jgi:hypothetical protein